MAWFDDFTDAPTIVAEKTVAESYLTMFVGAEQTPPKYKQKITSSKFTRTCLTQAAAEAAVLFYNAQSGTSAIMRRVDGSGQYAVEVVQETYEYTDETEEGA